MRKLRVLLPLAVAVLLAAALLVQAGGNGAVHTGLYVGKFITPTNTEIDGPRVGKVIFSPTANGMMNATVQVKDGKPDTEFECYVVPPSRWVGDRKVVTLNKQGKGTVHLQVAFADPLWWIKVVVVNRDLQIAYITERLPDFQE